VLILECRPIHTQRAVCRAYLAVRDRCVASVKELASMLGIKYHTALYAVKKLVKLVPSHKLVAIPRKVWKIKRISRSLPGIQL